MKLPLSDAEMVAIREAIYAGRKIEAIKLYRQGSGQGLKEAKDFVEALEIELRCSSPERFAAPVGGGGCFGMGLLLVIVVVILGQTWALYP